MHQQFKNKGLTVLAVCGDNETLEEIRGFVEDKKLSHTILVNGSGVAMKTYSVRAYPTTYWIDRSGKVVSRKYGYHRFEDLRSTAQRLLKEGSRRSTEK